MRGIGQQVFSLGSRGRTWLKKMTQSDSGLDEEVAKSQLGWLVDIPLFIDSRRVSQLYELTIQPIFEEYQRTPVKQSLRELEGETDRVTGGVEAGIEGGGMLSMIASGKLGGWIEGEHTKTGETENATHYQLSQSPQRQLAQIAIQYFASDQLGDSDGSERNFHFVDEPWDDAPTPDKSEEDPEAWLQPPSPSDPRDLVVLRLPGVEEVTDEKGAVPSKLVPTAAEFEDGTVAKLYKEFEDRYEKPPRYPERDKNWDEMGPYYDDPRFEEAEGQIGDKVHLARKYYWKWFKESFNGKQAMKIVEDACQEYGDLRWIDFRLPLNESGYTLHLHIQPREEWNTGTFAYNFIKRGFKHGLTLVGTVKKEPDMDVLAIYER